MRPPPARDREGFASQPRIWERSPLPEPQACPRPDPPRQPPLTFRALALMYLAEAKQHESEATYRHDCAMVQGQLVPFFGEQALAAITPALAHAYQTSRLTVADGGTVLDEVRCLERMLSVAVTWGWIATNPLSGGEGPPVRTSPRMHRDNAVSLLLVLLSGSFITLGAVMAVRHGLTALDVVLMLITVACFGGLLLELRE